MFFQRFLQAGFSEVFSEVYFSEGLSEVFSEVFRPLKTALFRGFPPLKNL